MSRLVRKKVKNGKEGRKKRREAREKKEGKEGEGRRKEGKLTVSFPPCPLNTPAVF